MPERIEVHYEDLTEQKIREAIERECHELEQRRQRKREDARNLSAEIKKSFDEVVPKRDELTSYEFGSINGLASFRRTDIRDMKRPGSLRLGVFGPAGSGKSSFICTCERTVKEMIRGAADVKTEGGEGTVRVMDYLNGKWHYKLIDTRGFYRYGKKEIAAFSDLLYGKIRPGQDISFNDASGIDIVRGVVRNWLHGVIFVLKGDDARLKSGEYQDNLNPMRQFMRPRGISAITVITHRDMLEEDELEEIKELASIATGSAPNHIFFITNYLGDDERRPETEHAACDILNFALMMGERFVRIAKHQEQKRIERLERQRKKENELPVERLEQLFLEISEVSPDKSEELNRIRSILEAAGVRTTLALKHIWGPIVANIQMSEPVKEAIDVALKTIFP
ncbi:uncharacterized protein LOC144438560 [Glandiceps talaboti]